jgi:hypothetical protein
MRQLYEYTAVLSLDIVVAADNEEDAQKQIDSLSEDGWFNIADKIGVSDIDLFDVRSYPRGSEDDLAHISAPKRRTKAKKGREGK